ncbi:MAG: bifunctional methionine sulfoxide reductase B/A protein [Chitinophagales bacterium]|jgi:peptide methionine sulfoxide reductase msrA/msrB|nr:bifunctional methionine sulfoxide reductase B/A protein [Chitinophagales bacterium]
MMKDYPYQLNKNQWKEKLDEASYYVLREQGTERAYSGTFLLVNEQGNFKCKGCGEVLFASDMQFDSHCGWPSFDREVSGGKILQIEDNSHGMRRTEIVCANCGGHLGHIFDDGPTQTGKRYCVNSLSLQFEPEEKRQDTLVLGGGCFWCVETIFRELEGVLEVKSGYAGGKLPNPTYEAVCSGETGHAEVIRVVYDNSKISLETLYKVFFESHDPTQLNRQGNDVGTQYRSVIFYANEFQKSLAQKYIAMLQRDIYSNQIETTLEPLTKFYDAEAYHDDYYNLNKEKNSYCTAVIQPKRDKVLKMNQAILKK